MCIVGKKYSHCPECTVCDRLVVLIDISSRYMARVFGRRLALGQVGLYVPFGAVVISTHEVCFFRLSDNCCPVCGTMCWSLSNSDKEAQLTHT